MLAGGRSYTSKYVVVGGYYQEAALNSSGVVPIIVKLFRLI